MKLESIYKPTTALYKCYTIFNWHQCCRCKKDFRREHGYRALTGPYYGGAGTWRYVCGTCGPNIETADIVFTSSPWIPARPLMPPPQRPKKA